jgi:hypothetical protein
MARNVSGTYSLPLPNVVPGTTIQASWANTTLNDLGPEVTDSLSRSGKGAMLAPLLLTSGAVGAPGLAFSLEPTTGWYRAGANDARFTVAGTDRLKMTASTLFISTLAAAGAGVDFTLNTINTRTAGSLFKVQNATADVLNIVAPGLLVGTSQQAAAGAGVDFTLNTINTRTAGSLFNVQNNGTSRFKVDTAGFVTMGGTNLTFNGGPVTLSNGPSIVGNAATLFDFANVAISKLKITGAGELTGLAGLSIERYYAMWHGRRQSANAVCSSTTVAVDLPTTSFEVTSGINYRVRFNGLVYAAASTTGFGLGIRSTGGPSMIGFHSVMSARNAAGTVEYIKAVAITDTPARTTGTFGTTEATAQIVEFYAQFTANTAGTVVLCLLSEVDASAVTVLANSFVELIGIANM